MPFWDSCPARMVWMWRRYQEKRFIKIRRAAAFERNHRCQPPNTSSSSWSCRAERNDQSDLHGISGKERFFRSRANPRSAPFTSSIEPVDQGEVGRVFWMNLLWNDFCPCPNLTALSRQVLWETLKIGFTKYAA